MKMSQEQLVKRESIVINMLRADPKVSDTEISKELKKRTGTGSTGAFLSKCRGKYKQQMKLVGGGTRPLGSAPAPHVAKRAEPQEVEEEEVDTTLSLESAKKEAVKHLRHLRDILNDCPELRAIGLVKKEGKILPFVDEQVTKRSTLEL